MAHSTYKARAIKTHRSINLAFVCKIHTVLTSTATSVTSIKPLQISKKVQKAGWLKQWLEVIAQVFGTWHWNATPSNEELWLGQTCWYYAWTFAYIAQRPVILIKPEITSVFRECGWRFRAKRHAAILEDVRAQMYRIWLANPACLFLASWENRAVLDYTHLLVVVQLLWSHRTHMITQPCLYLLWYCNALSSRKYLTLN